MKDQAKTKEQLINELVDLRQRVAHLEEEPRRRVRERTPELRKTNNDLQAEMKEHKQTEAASIQSEEKYHNLFNTVPDAIMIFDSDTRRFIDVNESALQMYGYTREEFLKLKQSDISSEYEASDLSIKETLAGKRSWVPVRHHRKKDGTIFPVEISASTFPLGERQVLCGVIRDITKRTQAEEKVDQQNSFLNTVIDSFSHPFVVINIEDYTIKLANSAAATGNIPETTTCYSLMHRRNKPCDGQEGTCLLEEVEKSKKSITTEHVHYSEDGSPRNIEVHAYPVVDEEGNLVQVIEYLLDITERKKAGQVVRESEERYRSIFEQAADSIVIVDSDGTLVEFNDRAHQNLGYTRQEFKKLKIADFEVIESEGKIRKHIERIRKKGGDIFETKHITKDGEKRDILVNSKPITIGGKVYFQSIWRDITERNQAEAALRQSEQRFRTVADFTIDSEYWIGPDNNLIYQSPSIERITGYTAEEFIENHPGLFSKIVHPSDKEQFRKHFTKDLSSSEVRRFTFRIISRSGEVRWLENITQPVYDNVGNFLGRRGSSRDISTRKEAEEELKDIFNLSPDMVAVFTTEGKLLKVNPSWEQVLGFTQKELLDLGWTKLVHPDDVEKTNKEVEKQLKGSSVANFVNRYKCKDGSYKTLEWQATYAQEGIVHATARDITERKRMEEELRESEERYRILFQRAAEGILVADIETREFKYVNPALCKMLGYGEEEMKQMSVADIHPKEDLEAVISEFEAQARGEKTLAQNIPCLRKDGTVMYADINTTAALIDGRERNVGFFTDITARKEAEEEARKYQQELKTIFDSVPAAIWYKDRENRIIRVNKASANSVGMKVEEIEGKSTEELFPQDDAEHYYQDDLEVMSSGKPKLNIIEKMQTASGERKWVCTDKVPYLDDQGNTAGIIAFVRDITERKHAEEQVISLAKFPSENPYPVLRVSRKGSILYANDASKPLFDDWGSKIGQLVPASLNKLITESLDSGQSRIEEIKSGDRILSFIIAPIVDAGYVNLYGRDITERKWAEQALTQRLEFEQLISGIRADFINLPLDNIDEGINRALETIARFGGAVRSSLVIVHDNQTKVTNTHEWCAQPSDSQIALFQGIPFETFGYYRNLLLREEYVVIRNIDDLPPEAHGEREWSEKYGFRALLFVPMILKGFLYGALGFYGQVGEEKDWSPHFVSLLNLAADVFVSVLERKRAEEMQRLQSEITANMSEGVYLIRTSDMVIVYTNPKFAEMFGYGPDEMVGQHVSIVNAPTDLTPEQTAKAIMSEIEKGGGYWQGKVNNIKKDGKPFWCYASVSVFDHPEYGEVLVTVHTDITERKEAEEELQKSREELKNLAAHLQSVREMERTSIAREIHDELGQALTALKMDLFWLRKRLPGDQRPYLGKIQSMVDLTDRTIDTMKRISTDLRPGMLDDLGLVAAIQWQAEEFEKRMGIKCAAAVDFEEIELDEEKRTAIFRIFQETLTNIARHADATRARVYLRKRVKRLELEVRDNGKGITEEQISDPKAFGLIGIRERVQYMEGEVTISGAPDRGTKVLVKIPLPEKGAAG